MKSSLDVLEEMVARVQKSLPSISSKDDYSLNRLDDDFIADVVGFFFFNSQVKSHFWSVFNIAAKDSDFFAKLQFQFFAQIFRNRLSFVVSLVFLFNCDEISTLLV